MNPTPCPSSTELARWRSALPGEIEGEWIEAHLADCPRCRRLVLEAHLEAVAVPRSEPSVAILDRVRHLSRHRRATRGAPTWLALAATILAVVGVGLWLNSSQLPESVTSVERAGGERAPILTLLAPPDNARAAAAVHFRWTPVPGARTYRLTLLDARGDLLAEERTRATELRVDFDSLTLPPGEPLYWAVRAELEDGGAVDSQPARLEPVTSP